MGKLELFQNLLYVLYHSKIFDSLSSPCVILSHAFGSAMFLSNLLSVKICADQ